MQDCGLSGLVFMRDVCQTIQKYVPPEVVGSTEHAQIA